MYFITKDFICQEDPKLSTKAYLSEATELDICLKQCIPFAIGFVTRLGCKTTLKWNVTKILIDSIFKTNREKMERLVIIGCCMGTGFPIAYMSLNQELGEHFVPRLSHCQGS